MTIQDQNILLIRGLYAAFGRGDVGALLALVTADAEWANPYGQGHFPGQWGKPCRGHQDIAAFFQAISQAVEVRAFHPYEFVAAGEKVVVLIRWQGSVRATNQPFSVTLVHVWTLRDGKIVAYMGFDDATAYGF